MHPASLKTLEDVISILNGQRTSGSCLKRLAYMGLMKTFSKRELNFPDVNMFRS